MRVIHQWTAGSARIAVEGLARAVRVLHVTDQHIARVDERDAEFEERCRGVGERFAARRLNLAGQPVPTEATFQELLARGASETLDLLAVTGDLIHFPAQASIQSAAETLSSSGVPWLYTSGNHDWHFPGLSGGDELRAHWWPKLAPLHHGEAAQSAREIAGIRFLAIDDSNYQISETQLAFAREQLAAGQPTVLLIHIPLSLPTLRPPTIERWKAPILIGDPDWDLESRAKWGTRRDGAATLEFVRLLTASPNLVAVLCGHIHFAHAGNLHPRAVQYVGAPGYAGGSRLLEFVPLEKEKSPHE